MGSTAARWTGRGAFLLAAASAAAIGLAPVAVEAAPPAPVVAVSTCTNGGITTVSWSRTKLATLSITWVRSDGVREIHDLTAQLPAGKKGSISYPTPATSLESWATYKTTATGSFTDSAHVSCT